MDEDPELGGLELYKRVLCKTYAHSDDYIDEILECAAGNSQEWVDDTGKS